MYVKVSSSATEISFVGQVLRTSSGIYPDDNSRLCVMYIILYGFSVNGSSELTTSYLLPFGKKTRFMPLLYPRHTRPGISSVLVLKVLNNNEQDYNNGNNISLVIQILLGTFSFSFSFSFFFSLFYFSFFIFMIFFPSIPPFLFLNPSLFPTNVITAPYLLTTSTTTTTTTTSIYSLLLLLSLPLLSPPLSPPQI